MGHILISGGARSGKSLYAEKLVLAQPGKPVYIATAKVLDDEMRDRVAQHQARRDGSWVEHAEPVDLAGAIAATDGQGCRLVDCLTMWLTNLMLSDEDMDERIAALVDALGKATSPVVFVTNEVGSGIVPDNKLGRDFRDMQGRLNQQVGAVVDEIFLVVCGHPMKVK